MELINFIDNYKNAKIHMRINYVKPSFKIIKKEIVSFKSDELINYLKENKIDNIYICDDIAEELKNNYKCKFENDCFFVLPDNTDIFIELNIMKIEGGGKDGKSKKFKKSI